VSLTSLVWLALHLHPPFITPPHFSHAFPSQGTLSAYFSLCLRPPTIQQARSRERSFFLLEEEE